MSRSAEFGTGATYKQRDMDGNESMRNAAEVVGASKFSPPREQWSADAIEMVEDERVRSQSDWWD